MIAYQAADLVSFPFDGCLRTALAYQTLVCIISHKASYGNIAVNRPRCAAVLYRAFIRSAQYPGIVPAIRYAPAYTEVLYHPFVRPKQPYIRIIRPYGFQAGNRMASTIKDPVKFPYHAPVARGKLYVIPKLIVSLLRGWKLPCGQGKQLHFVLYDIGILFFPISIDFNLIHLST